jgi:hypothetical protein
VYLSWPDPRSATLQPLDFMTHILLPWRPHGKLDIGRKEGCSRMKATSLPSCSRLRCVAVILVEGHTMKSLGLPPTLILSRHRDQCCADPGCLYRIQIFTSRIPRILGQNDSESSVPICIKEFKSIFNPKKELFLSSRKNYLGCLSRIPNPDPDFCPSRIPDPRFRPGVKKAPDPDPPSATLIMNIFLLRYGNEGFSVLKNTGGVREK